MQTRILISLERELNSFVLNEQVETKVNNKEAGKQTQSNFYTLFIHYVIVDLFKSDQH